MSQIVKNRNITEEETFGVVFAKTASNLRTPYYTGSSCSLLGLDVNRRGIPFESIAGSVKGVSLRVPNWHEVCGICTIQSIDERCVCVVVAEHDENETAPVHGGGQLAELLVRQKTEDIEFLSENLVVHYNIMKNAANSCLHVIKI